MDYSNYSEARQYVQQNPEEKLVIDDNGKCLNCFVYEQPTACRHENGKLLVKMSNAEFLDIMIQRGWSEEEILSDLTGGECM